MTSALAPFRHRAFTVIWGASVIALLGRWMHDVGAGWLMATLTPSPLWVALVQTSSTLPVFLLALPAGTLGDMLDRRRLVIATQVLSVCVSLALTLLVLAGRMTPPLLLAFTTLLGISLAVYGPSRNALVPLLVPRRELASAIVLNSLGVNLSRALGPALAGVLILWLGIAAPFAVHALAALALILAYGWWRPLPEPGERPPREPFGRAILTGLRYGRDSALLRAAMIRVAAFYVFASAYWGLLPVIAKVLLGGTSALYGVLLGCIGAGAVTAALVLPRLRSRIGDDRVVGLAPLLAATATGLFALAPSVPLALATSLAFGAAWISTLSLINATAQLSLPDWVRARGMALLLSAFFGSLALGSLAWGQVASLFGLTTALGAAALGAVAAGLAVRRFPLAEAPAEG